MKNAKRFGVIIGLVIAIAVLSLPIGARADYTYSETDRDDTIYFGYCDSCRRGSPGLLICRMTDGSTLRTVRSMDRGTLTIQGLGGDDLIIAVHRATRADRNFGDFNNLTYSSIRMEGGNGNDCLIGTIGNQILYGGANDDYLQGYPGDDELHGGSGNDFLLGDQATTPCGAMVMTIFSWGQAMITSMAALAGCISIGIDIKKLVIIIHYFVQV